MEGPAHSEKDRLPGSGGLDLPGHFPDRPLLPRKDELLLTVQAGKIQAKPSPIARMPDAGKELLSLGISHRHHAPSRFVCRALHICRPLYDKMQRIPKGKNAGGEQSGVFSQTVARKIIRIPSMLLSVDEKPKIGTKEDGGLRDCGLLKLFLRSVFTELRKGKSADFIRLLKISRGAGEAFQDGQGHAGALSPLP